MNELKPITTIPHIGDIVVYRSPFDGGFKPHMITRINDERPTGYRSVEAVNIKTGDKGPWFLYDKDSSGRVVFNSCMFVIRNIKGASK